MLHEEFQKAIGRSFDAAVLVISRINMLSADFRVERETPPVTGTDRRYRDKSKLAKIAIHFDQIFRSTIRRNHWKKI